MNIPSNVFQNMLQNTELGAAWDKTELQIFLSNFHANGLTQLEEIQSQLLKAGYERSVKNIISVYLQNKNFLTTKQDCSADDLFIIMQDQLPLQSSYQSQNVAQASFDHHSLQQYLPMLSQLQQHLSSTQQLQQFKQINNNNGKKTKARRLHRNSTQIHSLANTNLQFVKQPRKTLFKHTKPTHIDFSSPCVLSQAERLCEPCQHYNNNPNWTNNVLSLPTIRFLMCEFFYSFIDRPFFNQNILLDLMRSLGLAKVASTSTSTYAPSLIEYEQEQENNIQINNANNTNSKQTLHGNSQEKKVIRLITGRPRRFSPNFIFNEVIKLKNYRQLVRDYLLNAKMFQIDKIIKNPYLLANIVATRSPPLDGLCLTLHPICGHFHLAKVVANVNSKYIVSYQDSATELGVHKITDERISMDVDERFLKQIQQKYAQNRPSIQSKNHSKKANQPSNNGNQQKENGNNNNNSNFNSSTGTHHTNSSHSPDQQYLQGFVKKIDFNAMALLILVLERKTSLIEEMRQFNDKAENRLLSQNNKNFNLHFNNNDSAQSQQQRSNLQLNLNNQFFQEYGWTGVHINVLDNALKHICAKFRLRGIQQYQSNQQDFSQLCTSSFEHQGIQQMLCEQTKTPSQQQVQSQASGGSPITASQKGIDNNSNSNNMNMVMEENNLMKSSRSNLQNAYLQKKLQQIQMSVTNLMRENKESQVNNMNMNEENNSNKQCKQCQTIHLINDDSNEQNSQSALTTMIEKCLGVLQSCSELGRISLEQNSFLQELSAYIYDDHQSSFHDINQTIISLNKIASMATTNSNSNT